MPIESEKLEQVAETVSSETLRQMNFLTGSSIKDLRNVTVVVSLNQKRYELQFDEQGHMKSRQVE